MKSKLKTEANWSDWFKFVLVAVLFPAVAVWYSLKHVEKLQTELRLQRFQFEAAQFLDSLRQVGNADPFLCRKLSEIFQRNRNPKTLKEEVAALSGFYQLDLNFLIWQRSGNVYWSNIDHESRPVDWKQAYRVLLDISKGRKDVLKPEEEENLRKIFGPHFFPRFHYHSNWSINPRLIRSDSAGKWPCAWIRAGTHLGMMVQVAAEKVDDFHCLQKEIMNVSPPTDTGAAVVIDDKLVSPSPIFSRLETVELLQLTESYENLHHIKGLHIYKSFFNDKLAGLLAIESSKISGLSISGRIKTILFAFAVALFIALIFSFFVFIVRVSVRLNIRKQLIILFLVSNAFPMLIMGVIGYDYLIQYENFLQIEAFSKGLTYLQNIDEMFVAELSHQLRRMNRVFTWLPEDLKKSPPNRSIVEKFLAAQEEDPFRMVLIGSHTPYVGSEMGIMADGRFVDVIDAKLTEHESMKSLIDYLDKLGKYYLSRLNKEPISEKTMLQIELVAESLGQIRPIEMLQEFFAATGSFWQWGMGKNYFPAHIRLLHLYSPEIADYVFLYLYKPQTLQSGYIKRIFDQINRNRIGMKIVALYNNMQESIPENIIYEDFIQQYIKLSREKSGSELEFCDWQGERHILISQKCIFIDRVRLIGLFPAAEIARKATEKYHLFMASGLLSLLVALSLGLLVSRSFLNPLSQLQKGVEALKDQNFAYRLDNLGNDEFGNLAAVFNETLVDLEEIQIASKVEEKLFANLREEQQVGKLVFSGISHSNRASSSDFIDSFPVDETRQGFVIGDVAGHGIATSLVKSFFKACLLLMPEKIAFPAETLRRISQIFSQGNTGRQKKFMSVQYLVADTQTGEIEVANAGHCYPVLLDKTSGFAEIIELPSTIAGAGRKNRVNSAILKLQPEKRLILYSGGFYRNQGLSHELFCRFLHEEAGKAPAEFNESVMQRVLGIDKALFFNDDLSIISIDLVEVVAEEFNQQTGAPA